MKKKLYVAFIICLVLFVLVACGDKEETAKEDTEQATETETTEEVKEPKDMTLTEIFAELEKTPGDEARYIEFGKQLEGDKQLTFYGTSLEKNPDFNDVARELAKIYRSKEDVNGELLVYDTMQNGNKETDRLAWDLILAALRRPNYKQKVLNYYEDKKASGEISNYGLVKMESFFIYGSIMADETGYPEPDQAAVMARYDDMDGYDLAHWAIDFQEINLLYGDDLKVLKNKLLNSDQSALGWACDYMEDPDVGYTQFEIGYIRNDEEMDCLIYEDRSFMGGRGSVIHLMDPKGNIVDTLNLENIGDEWGAERSYVANMSIGDYDPTHPYDEVFVVGNYIVDNNTYPYYLMGHCENDKLVLDTKWSQPPTNHNVYLADNCQLKVTEEVTGYEETFDLSEFKDELVDDGFVDASGKAADFANFNGTFSISWPVASLEGGEDVLIKQGMFRQDLGATSNYVAHLYTIIHFNQKGNGVISDFWATPPGFYFSSGFAELVAEGGFVGYEEEDGYFDDFSNEGAPDLFDLTYEDMVRLSNMDEFTFMETYPYMTQNTEFDGSTGYYDGDINFTYMDGWPVYLMLSEYGRIMDVPNKSDENTIIQMLGEPDEYEPDWRIDYVYERFTLSYGMMSDGLYEVFIIFHNF